MSTTDPRVDVDLLCHEIRRHARILVGMRYIDVVQGEAVDTYARSGFEDTRRKTAKCGAMGSTIRATKP